ncbi:hypothetical protein N7509_000386 [Penicillium cosmopolitanum]|uniref:Azaphilone pigments biosynthesis cluster protein L N-terminal domain-containing protein n=1 Tax=Penicillium cosmopolitanum TaxID=1131564 RepID=A0A9W9WAW1_9EURO|nr:uncharacterized protein N7509_000386 [Penicillium cosmopolitanum]KAJ5413759.1 hypothetical protein N7509_000386 [Penicillium cosmopolitanum]
MTASALAVITAAVQSTKSLYGAVSRYRGRDKTLGRLQDELQDLTKILESLARVIDEEITMLELLQSPIDRCSRVCREFEESMESFWRKSKTSIRDWTKMEFMRGDINEFIEMISGYKSTISVGLGTVNMFVTLPNSRGFANVSPRHAAKISQDVLKQYNEMIQDTVYNLELHLQRIDEKVERFNINSAGSSDLTVDLNDEREVTKQCLRVCEDARHCIESIGIREFSLLQDRSQNNAEDDGDKRFQAQLLTRQALDENRDSFSLIISQLRNRLESLILKNDPSDEKERARLQEDINSSKQCLEVCRVASEVSNQKTYRIGEVIAEGDSDQVVVTTLADLFDIKRAVSQGNSAQLVGSMTDEALRHLTERRYSSRFGSHTQKSAPAGSSTSDLPSINKTKNQPTGLCPRNKPWRAICGVERKIWQTELE